MRTPPHLPAAARLWLRLWLNEHDRRGVVNDLGERYRRRHEQSGSRKARAWLRRQLLSYPYHLLRGRSPNPPTDRRRLRRVTELSTDLWRDFRQSVRSLFRTPVLALTIVITVGLGIGATTAIFGVVNAVLIQPLPYATAGELYRIYTDAPPNRWPLSVADYLALTDRQTGFEQVAGFRNASMTFNRGDVAERVTGRLVTSTYFPILGITPLHGTLFTAADDVPGNERTVVVSHRFWTRFLGGDQGAIGTAIRLNGRTHTLVGVLPSDVGPLDQTRDFFMPAQWETPPRKGPFFITALARLRPETDLATGVAELRAINRRLFPVWEDSYQDQRASWGAQTLKAAVVGDVGTTLLVVLGAAGFVLLIACVNAANLLLARAAQREREVSVRAALGASRGRLLQYLLTESTLLALGGAAIGLLVVIGGTGVLRTVGSDYVPRAQEIALTGPVFVCFGILMAVSLLLFGVMPSLQGAAARVQLHDSARTTTASIRARRLRRALVVAQFAVAAPLLVGGGLLLHSLANLQRVDPGFDGENLLTLNITVPAAQYPERSEVDGFWRQLKTQLEALPGVTAVGFGSSRPPNQIEEINNFDLEDDPTPPGQSQPTAPWLYVTADYFPTLGVSLVQGRTFTDADRDDAPPVALVDQTWAQRFYPESSPVGRRFQSGGCTSCAWTTIVGVVGDVTYTGLDDRASGAVYVPMSTGTFRYRFVFIRTASDPLATLPSVRAIVRRLDAALPITSVATANELVHASLDSPRYLTILVGAFATVALLLSVVGIYGVMSHYVQQQAKAIGIRMALGGTPQIVARAVVTQGMILVTLGIAVGLGVALVMTRYMSSLLFEVGTTDAVTFGGVAILMLSVAWLVCFVPARRAAGLDPVTTLREN